PSPEQNLTVTASTVADTSGGDGDQTPTATAPVVAAGDPPADAVILAATVAPPSVDVAELLGRGDGYLGIGDVTSARLFYERAADAGSGQGAMRLGATFDPNFLGRTGLAGARGDQARADMWYQRARGLGTAAAAREANGREAK